MISSAAQSVDEIRLMTLGWRRLEGAERWVGPKRQLPGQDCL